jgi:peptidoglycan/xylan/chitin deacetylase (PgdA/CDA1 family)
VPSDPGIFTISLDFELYWGVRDKRALESYRANLLGVRQAAPRLLDAFTAAGARATWATVGFLVFDDKEELLAHLPAELPTYRNAALSPYPSLEQVGPNEKVDPCHFARSLVRQIAACEGQEVGSHTFSHYYCLEDGQTDSQFRADLDAAKAAARLLGLELKSLVFPRNQFNAHYLGICREAGFTAFRGNPSSWIYRGQKDEEEGLAKRGARLADSYLPISGMNSHRLLAGEPTDVPASRFLRPASRRLAALDSLRLERITGEMTHAARRGLLFHLWWHPHNFGAATEENLAFLGRILDHYRRLAGEYGMVARTMGEAAAATTIAKAA